MKLSTFFLLKIKDQIKTYFSGNLRFERPFFFFLPFLESSEELDDELDTETLSLLASGLSKFSWIIVSCWTTTGGECVISSWIESLGTFVMAAMAKLSFLVSWKVSKAYNPISFNYLLQTLSSFSSSYSHLTHVNRRLRMSCPMSYLTLHWLLPWRPLVWLKMIWVRFKLVRSNRFLYTVYIILYKLC